MPEYILFPKKDSISSTFSWLALTNPADVARVERRTFICTRNRQEAIPTPKVGVQGTLGNWMSLEDMDTAIRQRFPGCMKGRYKIWQEG
jgi:phosphoenolpyruvate carboxykinase (GTP)